ncbi:MAG: EAL domain-containing protein [Methylobacter sp.]|uniref:EAL domain-containing protein n=1 Tax=Methylobacter sp. TaxID=2051955 RepID=UPI00272F025F|nr:EAL domain-containing protein [Methylobacter sp.]MDP1664021.1 EAL domain-containing protein [Methylobacter sp.]
MISIKDSRSVKYLLLALIASIFVGEALVMLFIDMLLPPLSRWLTALIDAVWLLTLIFPAIYFLVFRPLKTQLIKQKQAETMRQEAVDRLQKIASQAPGIVFQFQLRLDGSCCVPYANEGLLKIYRISPEDVREDASYVFTVVHPDDLENHLASIQTSAQDLIPWTQEYRLKFGDEPECWLFGNALPQRLADGSTLWHGFITDITERKQAETELHIAATAFESQEGMVITDTNNVIIKVNQAFIRLTGYSSEELLNRRMNILKSGRHDEDFYASMWDSITHTGTWQGEIWNQLKNAEVLPTFVTITAVKNNGGEVINYVATYTDITERKVIEEKINNLAFYDSLTQLPNRVLLADRMHQTLARCRRNKEIAAVCMLDLDGFKQVNDTLGHASGDQLLWDVAQRLKECIRQEDTAARFGGDEFALLLGGFTTVSECEQTLARIVSAIAAPYRIFGQVAHISASIGVTLFPEDSSDPDLLLRHADQVMYEVKQNSKNGYKLFNSVHEIRNQTTQDFLKKIDDALVKGQFELYYQPKVNCRLGKVVGADASVYWNHAVLGILAPSEFMPVIEHDDLIIALGEWTIQKALLQLNEWRKAGFNIQVSVNISARQFHNQQFLQRLQELLAGHDSEIIQRLEIEIIETAALKDVIAGADAIRRCRAMGIRVTLDDFGTGFSSLVQSLVRLNHLAVDALKVDLSFVSDMLTDREDMAIVEGVVGLAASSRFQVIAKGVEYVDQILMLMELGCDVMQGSGFAKPMPAKRMHTWLAAFTPDPLWNLPVSYLTSRDYFELLLTEAKHRSWTNRVIANLDDPCDHTTPESLLDHQQCRFGQWYSEEGASHFHDVSEFDALDAVHQNIHQISAHLCEHHQAGMDVEADADKAQLLVEQHNMTSLVHHLLSDELLK